MNDLLTDLLWCGGVGWFLLAYSLGLDGKRHPASILFCTLFFWLIAIDPIAILLGAIALVIQKIGIGWRFVAWYVVLPYVLAAWRLWWLWWLWKKRFVAGGSRHRPPATGPAP